MKMTNPTTPLKHLPPQSKKLWGRCSPTTSSRRGQVLCSGSGSGPGRGTRDRARVRHDLLALERRVATDGGTAFLPAVSAVAQIAPGGRWRRPAGPTFLQPDRAAVLPGCVLGHLALLRSTTRASRPGRRRQHRWSRAKAPRSWTHPCRTPTGPLHVGGNARRGQRAPSAGYGTRYPQLKHSKALGRRR